MGWGSDVAVNCGVGHIHGLDPSLLWQWCRVAAVAPIRPLAWELPHVMGVALKSQKKKKRINKLEDRTAEIESKEQKEKKTEVT